VSESPRVVISILNWNGWQDTLECLESVRRLDYPNYLAVVVDNGSTNGSADKIKAWAEENLGPGHVLADYTRETALAGGHPETEQSLDRAVSTSRMVLIRNEENLGFTGGNNVAIHYALQRRVAADYVFLLNNDATLNDDCVTQLVSAIRSTRAGIAGAIIKERSGDVCFAGSGPYQRHLFLPLTSERPCLRSTEVWESPVAHGAGMLLSRLALDAIYERRRSYLNEDLFAYGDELDFCNAASQAGYKTVIVRDAVVTHGTAERNDRQRDASHFFYYFTRNNLLLARSLLPTRWKPPYHAAYLTLSIRRIAKRLVARQPGLARAMAYGLFDGYRGIGGKWKHHGRELKSHATK